MRLVSQAVDAVLDTSHRHLLTVSTSTPSAAATPLFCSPDAQARTILALRAKACAVLRHVESEVGSNRSASLRSTQPARFSPIARNSGAQRHIKRQACTRENFPTWDTSYTAIAPRASA